MSRRTRARRLTFAVADQDVIIENRISTVSFKECFIVACVSRFVTLGLIMLSDALIPDHDPGEDVRTFGGDGTKNSILNSFTRWDAAHYLNIAKNGYVTEQSFVFLPVYPYTIHFLAQIMKYFVGNRLAEDTLLIICGLIVSNVCFILSVLILRALCEVHYMTPDRKRCCIYLFCFNPASVFFSTIYSESMYCLFTLCGILYYETKLFLRSAFWFLLASGVRANGWMNIIPLAAKISMDVMEGRRKKRRNLIFILLPLTVVIIPFLLWNRVVPAAICSLKDISPRMIDWCTVNHQQNQSTTSHFSFIYGKLQEVHWDVGFLRQYQIRQIPNFLLALPTVVCASIYTHKAFPIPIFTYGSDRDIFFKVHSLHLLGILGLVLLFAHVQIITRVVYSSCPIIYYHIAESMAQCLSWNENQPFCDYCLLYFSSYFVLGIVLHSNFYPWT